jgi:Recombination endonuclease VII
MGYTDPEKAAAYQREWRAKHPERTKEFDRNRRERDREKDPSAATEKMRQWRVANPDKAKAQAQASYERFKQRMESDPVFRKRNRERQKWHRTNPDTQEQRREYDREWRKVARTKDPMFDRKGSLKSCYGLTLEQYDAMVAAQEGRCAVCGTDTPGNARQKHWRIDHCHDNGHVRGLLCHACNTGLGSFKDDPDLLRAAIAYLEKHKETL